MERILSAALASEVKPALGELAPALRELAACDYVLDVDPVFIGLHRFSECKDGGSYQQVAHCCWPKHARNPRERTTVVMPSAAEEWGAAGGVGRAQVTLEHEHFHVIDHAVWARTGRWIADQVELPTVSDYAARDKWERFACAGQRYLYPERTEWGQVLDRENSPLVRRLLRARPCGLRGPNLMCGTGGSGGAGGRRKPQGECSPRPDPFSLPEREKSR